MPMSKLVLWRNYFYKKQQFPLPQQDQLDDFDFGIYRSQTCPTSDTIDEYRAEHPTWGMPYGLPALSNSEHNTLLGWLRSGAKMSDVEPLTIEQKNAVDAWESYLNQPELKRQLTSRYIYEHLFPKSYLFFLSKILCAFSSWFALQPLPEKSLIP